MSITVKDAAGATQTVETPAAAGQATMAASKPVVIASNQSAVPISGAVTNAGTFVTQENGSALTALQLIDDTIVAQGTALGATKNSLMGGSVTTAAPTYTTGQISPFSMDTSGNQRVTINPSQLGALVVGAVPVVTGGFNYQTIAASQTGTVLQTSAGATGDYLESILCVVATPATSQVMIGDGAAPAVVIFPNNVGAGVGSYPVPLGITSKTGSWRVTTAAGVSIIASGKFS